MNEIDSQSLIVFFLQVCIMLMIALSCGQLMRKLRQPAVLGELIGGILLGPTVFGFFMPHLYTWLFPGNSGIAQAREALIRIGMLFFLLAAGLEVSLAQLRQKRWNIILTSLFGCIFPFGLGFGSVVLFPDVWQQFLNGNIVIFALFFGTALSISALPVVARILMDLRLGHHRLTTIIMTAATINDLIGWSLLAVILVSLKSNFTITRIWIPLIRVFAFSFIILCLFNFIGRPFLKWVRISLVWPSGFIGLLTVFTLFAAAIAEICGIHAIFGAFLVGVALYPLFEGKEEIQAREIIYQFSVSIFAPLYFVSIGLKTDFAAHFDYQLVLLVTLLATIGKVGGASFGAWISGITCHEAMAIGFALNARGAMELIVASVALDFGVIDQRMFVALVTMALITSMLSGPMLRLFMRQTISNKGSH